MFIGKRKRRGERKKKKKGEKEKEKRKEKKDKPIFFLLEKKVYHFTIPPGILDEY